MLSSVESVTTTATATRSRTRGATGDDDDGGTDPAGFDLLMSVKVTEIRGTNQPGRHRFPRFDVFMYTLVSYAALPLDRVFLFVDLPDADAHVRRQQLEHNATQLFHTRLVTLQHRQLVTQSEWREAWRRWIAPSSLNVADDAERLIFLCQNDDHPFVDFNQDVLREGLARLRADRTSRFRTLFMSHWPEPGMATPNWAVTGMRELKSVKKGGFGGGFGREVVDG